MLTSSSGPESGPDDSGAGVSDSSYASLSSRSSIVSSSHALSSTGTLLPSTSMMRLGSTRPGGKLLIRGVGGALTDRLTVDGAGSEGRADAGVTMLFNEAGGGNAAASST